MKVLLNWWKFISLLLMNRHHVPPSIPDQPCLIVAPFFSFWRCLIAFWGRPLIVVSQFYEGLCNCASLHPDPTPADEEMFDENHEWITAETLAAADADSNGNGLDEDMDDEREENVTKWRRTS